MRKALAAAILATLTMSGAAVGDDQSKTGRDTTGMKQKGPQKDKSDKLGMGQGHMQGHLRIDDQGFVGHMTKHHRTAIELADAVIKNGSSDEVKTLARRIRNDQQSALTALQGVKLSGQSDVSGAGVSGTTGTSGTGVTGTAGTGTAGVSGQSGSVAQSGQGQSGMGMGMGMGLMADPQMQQDLSRLKAAKGAEADRLFLELMITHHAQGVVVTHHAQPSLKNTDLRTRASDMFGKQAREIGEIQRLRESNRSAQK